jgi:Arc-like DNA binding domain
LPRVSGRLAGADMPRKKVVQGKRYPLNMRTTKEMRDKLERAAAESGRSLVGEVEYRLERSFDRDEVVKLVNATIVKEWLKKEIKK